MPEQPPGKQNLFELDLAGMEAFFVDLGEKPYRARQAMNRLYKKEARDFDAMTEFGASLREKLQEAATLALPRLLDRQVSRDGTVKLLLALADGEPVETVLIPDEDRLTQCISTQAGCAMGCKFCRTASAGLTRNLTSGEIVTQLVVAQQLGGFDQRVSNIVFMGMGEPLHNLENMERAFRVLSSDYGPNIGKRRITISTCGLVDKMRKLDPDMLASLAISLNATTDEVRDEIMPINHRYPIRVLMDTLKTLPLPARARYTIEYVMLGGLNDTLDDAKRLVRLLSDVRSKVNLIPYNPHEESRYRAPTPRAVEAFQTYLLDKKFTCVVRKSRGDDILAACGQLKALHLEDGPGAGEVMEEKTEE